MSYRFIKLSCNITKSTIWTEDDSTFRIWIWMMAEADRDGVIEATIPGIALLCRKSVEEVEAALRKFEAPDPYSSNPANDGRRIEKIPRGWRLLNYADHRDRKGGDPDYQKKRHAENQAAYRTRNKAKMTGSVTGHRSRSGHSDRVVTTEAEAEKNISNASHSHPAVAGEKKQAPEELIYQQYPRKVGHRAAMAAIKNAVERVRKGEGALAAAPNTRQAQVYLFRRTQEYARSPAGSRGDRALIPHPATWFNASRYLDDEADWQVTDQRQPQQMRIEILSKPGG